MFKKIKKKILKKIWSPERYARSQGVKVGKNCNIQTTSFGSEPYLIEIGNHVQITAGTKLFTHGGGWIFRQKHSQFDVFGKIIIKDNVYIGNNCLIMPGVTIESNTIVAAGSVVTKSVPKYSIVGGNPAKIIGDVDEFEKKMIRYNVNTKNMTYSQKRNFLLNLSPEKFVSK